MSKTNTDPTLLSAGLPFPYKGNRMVQRFECAGADRGLCQRAVGCVALVDVSQLAEPQALVEDLQRGMCKGALQLSGVIPFPEPAAELAPEIELPLPIAGQ